MRISDWSSDVCSSDLGVDTAEELASVAAGGSEVAARPPARHMERSMSAPTPLTLAPFSLALWATHLATPLNGLEAWAAHVEARSDERREGKECVSTCRFGWAPSH